jgi:hypothetical protein
VVFVYVWHVNMSWHARPVEVSVLVMGTYIPTMPPSIAIESYINQPPDPLLAVKPVQQFTYFSIYYNAELAVVIRFYVLLKYFRHTIFNF